MFIGWLREFSVYRGAVRGIAVAFLALVMAGCAIFTNESDGALDPNAPPASVLAEIAFPEIPGSVRVAMVVDLSSPGRQSEAEMAPFVIAAIEKLNEDGGVLGEPVGLEVLDGGNDVDVTLDLVEDQLRRGALLVVLGCEIETVFPAAQLAVEKGALVVSPCLTDDAFGVDAGDQAFTLGVPEVQQGIVLADHAIDEDIFSALTISALEGEASFAQCSSFSDRFAASGGGTLATVEYGDGGIQIGEVGESVAAFEPPGSFVLCAPEDDLSQLVSQVRSVDAETPILAGTEADNLFWVDEVDGLSDFTFLSWTALYRARSATEDQILDELDVGFRGGSDIASVLIMRLFAEAAAEAESLEGADLAAVLRDVELRELVLERAAFADGNVFTPSKIGVVKVTNGFPESLGALDPASPPEPPPPPPTTVPPEGEEPEGSPPTTG